MSMQLSRSFSASGFRNCGSPVTYSQVEMLAPGFGAPDPWGSLDEDIAWLIFRRIFEGSNCGGGLSDLSSARLVCRSWASHGALAVMALKPTSRPLPKRWHTKFANVRVMDLSGASRFVLGQPLNPISRLVCNIKRHACFSSKVDDCFQSHLPALHALEQLRIGQKKPVSSDSVATMALLPHLKNLDLTGAIMSDDGLFQLRDLTSLTSLQLEGCGRLHSYVMQSALRDLTSLTRLNLKGCCKGVTSKLIAALRCPRLRFLSVHGCCKLTESGLSHLARFRSLEELDVGGVEELSDNTMRLCLAGLTTLRRLDISWSKSVTDNGLGALSVLTRLEDLNISFCHKITNLGIEDLLRVDHASEDAVPMPQLKRLNISWNFRITDEALECISLCPKIDTLNVDSCRIADMGMETLSRMTTLTELDLSNLSELTDLGLAELGRLTGLRQLGLKWCSRLTDGGLSGIQGLTGLEHIDLRCCSKLTDDGVNVLKDMKSLSTMDLRLCNKISKEAIASLGDRFVPYESLQSSTMDLFKLP